MSLLQNSIEIISKQQILGIQKKTLEAAQRVA